MISVDIDALSAGSDNIIADFHARTSERSLLIAGAVGAGKSLLGRALCGDFQDSTWIKVQGRAELGADDFGLPRTQIAAPRIGYLPQNSSAYFLGASVIGEVFVSQYCSSASMQKATDGLNRWREESPFANRADLPPLALSGGQQRLFMLEVLLGTSPDHLVIDGGMVALDPEFKQRAASLIQAWMNANLLRTMICFGSMAETTWFDFRSVVSLPSRSTAVRQAPSIEAAALRPPAGPEPATEVLLFDSISAGPLVAGRRLIDGVTFRIRESEFIGLRGSNGIGKSTLLRLVAGIRRPEKGEIFFRGQLLKEIDWPGLVRGVGYLPQESELAGPSALRQPEIGEKNPAEAAVWKFWETFFGLHWMGDVGSYWSMSSGQRTRASLLLQAVCRPRLWILDEPTARIDALEAKSFLKAVREIDPDTSAIVVSHDSVFLKEATDVQYELTADGMRALTTGA